MGGPAGGFQFGSSQGASFTVALRWLRWIPPVRFIVRPSASTGADVCAVLDWSGTGGAEGGAGAGAGARVKLEDA